jgi:predicted transcriptional regulator
MAQRHTSTLTRVELEFMGIVWSAPEVTTEHIQKELGRRGRALTGGSIRKILSILMKKGYVARRQEGNTFFYKATVPLDVARKSLVADLLSRAFGGSAGLLVAAVLDARKLPREELEDIKKAIAQREMEGGK